MNIQTRVHITSDWPFLFLCHLLLWAQRDPAGGRNGRRGCHFVLWPRRDPGIKKERKEGSCGELMCRYAYYITEGLD